MKELKRIIKNKLALIDMYNLNSNGEYAATKLYDELRGIKQACHTMGMEVTYSCNPYFYKDKQPSTFKIIKYVS